MVVALDLGFPLADTERAGKLLDEVTALEACTVAQSRKQRRPHTGRTADRPRQRIDRCLCARRGWGMLSERRARSPGEVAVYQRGQLAALGRGRPTQILERVGAPAAAVLGDVLVEEGLEAADPEASRSVSSSTSRSLFRNREAICATLSGLMS